jgi:hypothetical protein
MTADSSIPPRTTGWADEYRLEILLARPEVQSMVSACAQNARVGMSGEEFLVQFANTMQLLTPMPGARSAFLRGAAHGRERSLRRGYQTGKSQSAEFTAPIGHVITAVLCSLARNSQAVTGTEQLEDGCVLTADIPSDRKTFGGILTVEIGPTPDGTAVEGTAMIPGQLYDWGKSKKVLATLIADVPAFLPT